MNDRQENRLTMIHNVYQACTEFNTVWQGHPGFVAVFGEFSLARNLIMSSQLEQGKFTEGVTVTKAEARAALIDLTVLVAKALYAYAKTKGDAELAAQVKVSRSGLLRVRDAELEPICRRVLDEAANRVTTDPLLVDYGVTAAMVDDLEDVVIAFPVVLTAPRQAIGYRKTATAQLEINLRKAAGILREKLDGLMEQFRTVYPEFFDQYFQMRQIVNNGVTTGSNTEPEPEPVPTV